MVPGMHSHLELQWQLPGYRRFARGLTRHCRLIRYDKLGTGLSDPTISTPTVDERVDDLTAVAAACGATTPVMLGFSEGGPLAIRFAASHPVSGLVLYGTSVRPPPPEAQAELDLWTGCCRHTPDALVPMFVAPPPFEAGATVSSPWATRWYGPDCWSARTAAGLWWRGPSPRSTPTCGLPTYFRRAAGAGWALVGDAAHHKDPLAARGIADALLGAELLTDYVLRGWDNDLDGALRAYAAELMRMLQPTALLNDQLAGLDLPAEQADGTWQALQAAERQVYRPHHWRSNHDNAPGASASAVRRTSRPAGSGPR
jgi:pimeloyl-ACP methyl ester carboxylesterase